MATDTGLWKFDALEMTRQFERKQLSPVEVIQSVFERVSAFDKSINAFAHYAPDEALTAAKQSEERWSRGEPLGPVDGVPVAIKDLILTKGWPTLRGSLAISPDQPWSEDSPATARLREGGAVLFGKTTTAEFGWKGLSDCPVHGATRNPWNTRHTAGGSSGGSSAGAAAGFGPLHVVTDGGGSGRMPASHTGVVGFKPTLGRVAVYPYSQNGTLYNVTPMARTVGDTAALFEVIGRPDPRDFNSLPPMVTGWRKALTSSVKGLKIAFSPTLGYATVAPDVAELAKNAVSIFAELGALVEEQDPGIENPMSIFRTFWATGAARLLNSLGPDKAARVELGLQDIAAEGHLLDAVTFASAVEKREALGRHFLHFHQKWDLLVTPMVAQTASMIDDSCIGLGKHTPLPAFTYLSPFAYPFNLTHQPAITVPCGVTAAGLPVGLQIVGAKYMDLRVLEAALAFEQAKPFPTSFS